MQSSAQAKLAEVSFNLIQQPTHPSQTPQKGGATFKVVRECQAGIFFIDISWAEITSEMLNSFDHQVILAKQHICLKCYPLLEFAEFINDNLQISLSEISDIVTITIA